MKKSIFLVILVLILGACSGDDSKIDQNQEMESVVTERGYLNKPFRLELSGLVLKSDSLPEGLTWNSEGEILSGTPKESGVETIYFQKNGKVIPYRITIVDQPVWQMVVNHWIDLNQQGDAVTATVGDKITFEKPFFTLYKQTVKELYLCNGYLKAGVGCGSGDVAGFFQNKSDAPVLIPFGDPELSYFNRGTIQYAIRGEAPYRMLVISYDDFHRVSDSGARHSFQVIIHEYSSIVQYIYGAARMGASYSNAHLGSGAIIGSGYPGKIESVLKEQPSIYPGMNIILTPEGRLEGGYRYRFEHTHFGVYQDLTQKGETLPECSDQSDCATGVCLDNRCETARLTEELYHNGATTVSLPFPISLSGVEFKQLTVYENGWISPGDTPAIVPNMSDPGMNDLKNIPVDRGLFPFYSDVDLIQGGEVLYRISGEAPRRQARIEYQDISVYDYEKERYGICSVEVILDEWSGAISFMYGAQDGSDICSGKGVLAGIKSGNGTGLTDLLKDEAALYEGATLHYYPYNKQGQQYLATGLKAVTTTHPDGIAGTFKQDNHFWNPLGASGAERSSYGVTTVENRWIDTSGGSTLDLCQGCVVPIQTAQRFQIWGTARDQFLIGDQGLFLDGNDVDNKPIGGIDQWRGQGGLFPLIGDYLSSPQTIEYDTYDDNGVSYFVVTWTLTDADNEVNRFQTQIGTSGTIYFCYDQIIPEGKYEGIQSRPGFSMSGSTVDIYPESGTCIQYQPQAELLKEGDLIELDDQKGVQIPMGFTYQLNGEGYSYLYISENGLIIPQKEVSDLEMSMDQVISLGELEGDDTIIAPLWSDLKLTDESTIRYRVEGDISARKMIVDYQNIQLSQYDHYNINMQVILHEQSEEILFCYGTLSPKITGTGISGIRLNNGETALLQERRSDRVKPYYCYQFLPDHLLGGFAPIATERLLYDHLKSSVEGIYQGSDPVTLSLGLDGINYPLYQGLELLSEITIDPRGAIYSTNHDFLLKPAYQEILTSEAGKKSDQVIPQNNDRFWILGEQGAVSMQFDQKEERVIRKIYPEHPITSMKMVQSGGFWGLNHNLDLVRKFDSDGKKVCDIQLKEGCYPTTLDGDGNHIWVGCRGRNHAAPEGWLYEIQYDQLNNNCFIADHGGENGVLTVYQGNEIGSLMLAKDQLWIFPGDSNDYLGTINLTLSSESTDFYHSYRLFHPDASISDSEYTVNEGNESSGTPFKIIKAEYDGKQLWATIAHKEPSRIGMISLSEKDQKLTIKTHTLFSSEYITQGSDLVIGDDEIWVSFPNDGKIARFSPEGIIEDLFYRESLTGIGSSDFKTLWITGRDGVLEAVNEAGILIGRWKIPFEMTLTSDQFISLTRDQKKPQLSISVVTGLPDQRDRCSRKLVVQWENLIFKADQNSGGGFQVVIDSGYYLDHCRSEHPVVTAYPDTAKISYHYGVLSGNNIVNQSGGASEVSFQVDHDMINLGTETSGLISTGGGYTFYQW